MSAIAEALVDEEDVRAGQARVGTHLLPQFQQTPTDCVRACLASLLLVPARLLPTGLGETRDSWPAVRRWCRDLSGLDCVAITFAEGEKPSWPVYQDHDDAPRWCVVIQRRDGGTLHAVVACSRSGATVFDPWPDREPEPHVQHPVAEVWCLVDRAEAGS